MNRNASFLKLGFIMMLFVAVSSSVFAYDPVVTYRGNVKNFGTGTVPNINKSFMLDFKLYSDETGGVFLWGRKVPVKLQSDGSFYTELGDSQGSHIDGAECLNLVDAFAKSEGYLWLALQPVDCAETSREKIAQVPRATYSDKATTIKNVDVDRIDTETLVVENSIQAANVTVSKLSAASNDVTIDVTDPSKSIDMKGNVGKFYINGGITGIYVKTTALDEKVPSDTFAIVEHNVISVGKSYSTLVFPKGASTKNIGRGTVIQSSVFGGSKE